MSQKFNDRVIQNAHKIYYIAKVYNEKSMVVLSQIFNIPPIDFNAAAWAGMDIGLFKVDDQNVITLGDEPKEYQFGELAEHLIDILPYTIGKVNKNEAVLEEGYLDNWMAGFPQADVIVAVKKLLEDNVLAVQEIVDVDVIPLNREERRKPENKKIGKTEERVETTYTFYTLYENRDQKWHEKQFKDAKKLQKSDKEQTQAE